MSRSPKSLPPTAKKANLSSEDSEPDVLLDLAHPTTSYIPNHHRLSLEDIRTVLNTYASTPFTIFQDLLCAWSVIARSLTWNYSLSPHSSYLASEITSKKLTTCYLQQPQKPQSRGSLGKARIQSSASHQALNCYSAHQQGGTSNSRQIRVGPTHVILVEGEERQISAADFSSN